MNCEKVRRNAKRKGMTVFREIRSHKWTAARALLTGWGLWILSLVWFFPFVSHYFFAFKFPKPYPVTRPFASPEFFAKGLGIAFSLSDPIGSASSVMWRSTPRGQSSASLQLFSAIPFRERF